MRRITMRDFRWMGRPLVWEKDYRSVKLEVQAHMGLPYGPLLLAVSDESFDFEATVNVPQKGGFAGLCVYHLDTTFAAVGLNREAMEIHTAIAGSHNRSIIAQTYESEEVTWLLRRSLSHLGIGYRRGEDEAVWISSVQLPGLEKSISFGPYFANETEHPIPGWMHSIRYNKES